MKAISVRFLLILSIFLTVVSALITYLNVLQKKEATSLVIHHYQVIQNSTRMLSLMKDMEIGLRGYLITSDSIFLQPYQEAVRNIENDIDSLKLLVRENPPQLDILEKKLLPLVNLKRSNLEKDFLILKEFGRDSASHYAGMKISKARLDSIRFWTTKFIENEQLLLNERNDNLEQRYFINDVIRFSSFALIGITSLAALITIANKEKDNRKLLMELQLLNLQLEQKVKMRTSELEDANKTLIRLNEEKNNFLGITTHDLKAPLAGISGLLELMKLEKGSLTQKHQEYIQLMEETCENMQRLISDLLDLSRIEQGTTTINKEEVMIPKVAGQLEERFRNWADNKQIQLSFRVEPSLTTMITDKDILSRILDNLLSNAIKFSPKGKKVSLDVTREGDFVRFGIRDEGPGIRPEERHKLFRKFQKLSSRPTGGESSSGLGLSIARDLVDLLRGSIDVESDFGHGASFIIRIPKDS